MGRGKEWAKKATQNVSVLFHGSSFIKQMATEIQFFRQRFRQSFRKSFAFRFWPGDILKPHKVLQTGVVYDLLVKGSQHLDICACRLLHLFSQISSLSSQVACLKRSSTGKISLHPYLHGLSLWASGCISHHSTAPPCNLETYLSFF